MALRDRLPAELDFPFPPAALLGIGIGLPSVVNLQYVTPEVSVYEVRLKGSSQPPEGGWAQ